jgi:PAS domain S-box-containing protein
MASGLLMVGYYDYRLVALSIMISVLGAYASRELANRIRNSRSRSWLIWLTCGSTADGIGTWSMHYTGMMAFNLSIPVLYHWPTVLLSLLVGIAGSATAFMVLRGTKIGWRMVVAGIVLGSIGISGMHYTAMASMRLQGTQHHSLALATLAVLLAIAISLTAISLVFRDDSRIGWLGYHGSAWIRGAANPVMHYTAMAGTTFTYLALSPDMSRAVHVSSLGIAAISVVPVMLLLVVLLTSTFNRISKQKALLNELFEQSPQPVALLDVDNRILRVNREFTRLFGYTAPESQGRLLSALIIPEESRDEDRKYSDSVSKGKRVEVEAVRQRKDGSRLLVSIVRVPVFLPGGKVATYGIYRDITEQKRAQEALKATTEQLRALSASVQAAKEQEAARIAREIHDELGAALTSLRWSLEDLDEAISDAERSQLQEFRKKIEDMIALTETTINAVRKIASEVRPIALDELGLTEAIEWQAGQFQERTGIDVHCAGNLENIELSQEQSTAIFRIFQEALTNVLRHSKATRVNVETKVQDNEFIMTIRDNGRGIRDEEKSGQRTLGLLGMRERAHLMGGAIDIVGSIGKGTVVTVRIPVKRVRTFTSE